MIPYPWDPDWTATIVAACIGLVACVALCRLRWRGRA
jgi:hypothetical protein